MPQKSDFYSQLLQVTAYSMNPNVDLLLLFQYGLMGKLSLVISVTLDSNPNDAIVDDVQFYSP